MGVAEDVKKWTEMVRKKEELLVKSWNRVAFAWTLVALCWGPEFPDGLQQEEGAQVPKQLMTSYLFSLCLSLC